MTSEKNKYVSLFTKFVNNNERMVKEIQNNASVITDNTTQLDSLLEDFWYVLDMDAGKDKTCFCNCNCK